MQVRFAQNGKGRALLTAAETAAGLKKHGYPHEAHRENAGEIHRENVRFIDGRIFLQSGS